MSGFLVPDASVVCRWYLPEPMANEALTWLEAVTREEVTLVAPDLLLYEVGNVLWKMVRAEVFSRAEAKAVLEHVARSPIAFVDAATLALDALQTAADCGITVYDASYVALACSLNTRVVTADARLVRALEATPLRGRAVPLGSST